MLPWTATGPPAVCSLGCHSDKKSVEQRSVVPLGACGGRRLPEAGLSEEALKGLLHSLPFSLCVLLGESDVRTD